MTMKKQFFTLFELLISVGLLVILSVVLLRTFVLTADYWTASDEQARVYADAKVALAVISEDLENIVYRDSSAAENSGSTDITAPLWLEAVGYPGSRVINCYPAYPAGCYGAAMHMITRSALGRSNDAESDICQVSYYFVPPTQSGDDWSGTYSYSGAGELVRRCVDDNNDKYNFMTRTSSTSMNDVFAIATDDDDELERLIDGVLDFRIYAYPSITDWDEENYPVDLVANNGDRIKIFSGGEGTGQIDLKGAKNIKTLQVELTVIPPRRLEELREINNADDRAEYLLKYSRTFRKTMSIRSFKE